MINNKQRNNIMKRYFIDLEGNRHKVTESNMYDYLDIKSNQWCKILDMIRIKSGEREIHTVRYNIYSKENSLEYEMNRWNNHRDEVYAEWCADGSTKAEVDKNWAEYFDDLRKEIAELKDKLTVMEIDTYIACRPERTVKAFFDRFSNNWRTFRSRLETKVKSELNIP